MIRITSKCDACNGRGGTYYDHPCHDCFGQGEIPDHAATLDAYDAREPLVEEVIRLRRRQYRIPITRDQELKLASDLYDAIDKLAEWKPASHADEPSVSTSDECMWCGKPYEQHRNAADGGAPAKMPCGGFKQGYRRLTTREKRT